MPSPNSWVSDKVSFESQMNEYTRFSEDADDIVGLQDNRELSQSGSFCSILNV